MVKTAISFLLLILMVNVNAQEEFRLERVKTVPNTATVNDILVHNNQIFIATTTGLYKIDADDLETRLISNKNIDAICVAVKDEIWASIEGRYIQNMTTGESTLYNSPGLQIRDLEYSKGKIWIASNQGIITILTRTNEIGKISFDKKSGLPSNNVAFIHVDDQKQIWIGTDKGIVFINKKDKWKTYEKRLSMEAMHYNQEGMWLVSNEEMWVIDPYNRWYPAALDKGLKKGQIRDITADSTGRLYMASEILVRYDPYEETIESYAANTAIVSKVCTAVESDRDNRIWLGTKGGGLFLFGFADQAKTIEELVASRDQKIKVAQSNGTPIVSESIVEAEFAENTLADKVTDSAGDTPNEASLMIDQGSAANSSSNPVLASDVASVSEITSTSGVSDQTNEEIKVQSTISIEPVIKKTVIKKLVVTTELKNPVRCPDDFAQVSLNIEGGLPPYTILWDDDKTGLLEKDLLPGSYKVVVIDSFGTSSTALVDIDGKSPLQVAIINERSPSAEGRLDGNVKIGVSGGTAPYDIQWENGESGDRARRLTGGTHSILVTDASGCSFNTSIELKGAKIIPDLEISKVSVGQKLEIKNIYYEADSTDITNESFEALDEVFEFLNENTDVKIEIGGHTNSLPSEDYCDRVSTARAKSVADYLYDKGIDESRITYKGYGKRTPIASNKTKEGRRRNQRVEVKIISLAK